ncbi:phosphotransferase family protein [Litorivivens sp.]|uniref:phosphotransferase family protein n=1 Tax=Litorivivens sp. TaxID=2020868 RepID=UPI003564E46B
MTEELRPTPALDDTEAVRASLEQWFATQVYPNRDVRIPALKIPENTGMSNITLMFDCILDQGAQRLPMVARLQAQGEKLAFPEYNLPMQFDAMKVLSEIDGLKLPELVDEEPTGQVLGSPFYIMHQTAGRIPPDMPPYHMDGWLCEATPETRGALWNNAINMMATLHRQPIESAPIAGFIKRYDFPKSFDDQLSYWERYMDWGLENARNEDCEVALQWLRQHQPSEQCQRLCWGDSRMANIIFEEQSCDVAALLDWEMLCVGDPQQDIAWWIFMDELFSHGLGVPRLEGLPDGDATARDWQQLTGLHTDNLHYYRVFAGLRISLILARMSLATDKSMLEQSFASSYMRRVMNEHNN